jgi:hypothetical protein
MPTTTVHLPATLLHALDTLAGRKKVSRNRLVTEACQRLLQDNLGEWPPGFLEMSHLTPKDRKELAAAGKALERAIRTARRNRRKPPFTDAGR